MTTVALEKDGQTIRVNSDAVAEHLALGWQVAIASVDVENVAITIGDQDVHTINVAVQLLDAQGESLAAGVSVLAFLADDDTGLSATGTAPAGHVAVGTNGGCTHLVTDKVFMLHADANGQLNIDVTDSGTSTWYLVLILPTGKRLVSNAITFA